MQPDARGKKSCYYVAKSYVKPGGVELHQALKHFRDIILDYPITVFTDHAPVTELFKGRNLTA